MGTYRDSCPSPLACALVADCLRSLTGSTPQSPALATLCCCVCVGCPPPVSCRVPPLQRKLYPRNWCLEPGHEDCFGRLRVELRKPDGSPANPEFPTRKFQPGCRGRGQGWDGLSQGAGAARLLMRSLSLESVACLCGTSVACGYNQQRRGKVCVTGFVTTVTAHAYVWSCN